METIIYNTSYFLYFCLNRTMQYGNFFLGFPDEYRPKSLNRTMQYGNNYAVSDMSVNNSCLNRTMQYGNMIDGQTTGKTQLWFKSYYVVWKRKKNFLETYTHSSFKSYYVVWKLGVRQLQKAKLERSLNRTMQYGNTPKKRIIPKIRPGLNRTMQYGNYSGILKKKNIGSGFKSYYVVWKRPPFCAITFCATWFKSYYVVWKLYFILCFCAMFICLNRTMQYGNNLT